MRRRVLAVASVGAVSLVAASCADILGIDDGKARNYDASVETGIPDVVVADVSDASATDVAFSALSCGASKCNFALGQSCCRTGSATYKCVDASSECAGMNIPCDRPEQCPQNTEAGATLCCTTDVVDPDSGTYVATSVACLPEAECQPTPQHYILCGDDSSAECPPEAGCGASASALPTFLICK